MNPTDLPLRDIHLPAPVGWWPLAPGWWWLLGITLLLTAGVLCVALLRRYRKARLGHWLRPEFLLVTTKYQEDRDALALLQSISALLRRACISLYPREQVAGLTHERWLELLNKTGQTTQFSEGPGQLLADGPYRGSVSTRQVEQLIPLVESWIDRCSGQKLRSPGP
ncbi:MAG: DUF4381 domain-containing protein [Gammaproteobacteria bacterium]|nr:DUF4381 domain-containing protein [Gammaproteobacteria bacterium]